MKDSRLVCDLEEKDQGASVANSDRTANTQKGMEQTFDNHDANQTARVEVCRRALSASWHKF